MNQKEYCLKLCAVGKDMIFWAVQLGLRANGKGTALGDISATITDQLTGTLTI